MISSRITTVSVTNTATARIVCSSCRVANTFLLRLVGLLGRREMESDEGLLIKPSSGVHTFGMLLPIDIVALDRRNRVLGAWEHTGPWKIRGVSRRTHSVLELASGRIRQCGIEAGHHLLIEEKPSHS